MYLYLPLVPERGRAAQFDAYGRCRRWDCLHPISSGEFAEQKAHLNKAIGIMAIVILPVAISVQHGGLVDLRHDAARWMELDHLG